MVYPCYMYSAIYGRPFPYGYTGALVQPESPLSQIGEEGSGTSSLYTLPVPLRVFTKLPTYIKCIEYSMIYLSTIHISLHHFYLAFKRQHPKIAYKSINSCFEDQIFAIHRSFAILGLFSANGIRTHMENHFRLILSQLSRPIGLWRHNKFIINL